MKGMYNTDALSQFTEMVSSVKKDQQDEDLNRQRLMALDSQLATEKAERDLLPDRMKLESTKLQYDMGMGKMDMLLRTATTVNVLQDSQLKREIDTWGFGQDMIDAPYLRAKTQIDFVTSVMEAYQVPYKLLHERRMWDQQDLLNPLNSISAFLTAMGPMLLSQSKVIEDSAMNIGERVDFVAQGLLKKNADGTFGGFDKGVGFVESLGNYATGSNIVGDASGSVTSYVTQLTMDYGERIKIHEKDANGNYITTYKPLDDPKAAVEMIAGANGNQVARFVLDQALTKPDYGGSPEFTKAKDFYKMANDNAVDLINSVVVDPEKRKEIESKIKLLLFNTDPGAEDELRAYLTQNASADVARIVLGNPGAGLPGIKNMGLNLIGYADRNGEGFVFTKQKSKVVDGQRFIEGVAEQIMPKVKIIPDSFNAVINAKVQSDTSVAKVRGMSKTMDDFLQVGGMIIGRAMTSGMFEDVILDSGGKTSDGKPLDLFNINSAFAKKIADNISSMSPQLDKITSQVQGQTGTVVPIQR